MSATTQYGNDGGPAFPGNQSKDICPHLGMSLRDYFAAKAMQGDCVGTEQNGVWANDVLQEHLEARAALYYRIADAMLKARSE